MERRRAELNQFTKPFLQISGLAYQYEAAKSFALAEQSISLEKGELLVILGPSGSGKSTLLQLIAGLLRPSRGSIFMDGKAIHHLPPEKRNLSMLFQKPYLLPFLTVGANVEIGLKLRGLPARERRARAEDMLKQVGMADFYRRPIASLSGGQEQRAALARSLVIEPQLMLLDEPFSQLDPLLRKQMGRWLVDMKRKWDIPMIVVTHDREEALTLGDRFLVLRDGAAQQLGSLNSIYSEPANRWTANFMGFDNAIDGRKRGARVTTVLGELEVNPSCTKVPDGPVDIVIRSEWLQFDSLSSIRATIEDGFFRGEYTEVTLRVSGVRIVIKQLGYLNAIRGAETGVRLAVPTVWCLPKEMT
ncbi:ABC transporter ATP-binding protein [Paenibacillus sp. R14(2021)]|uniref:ABC transporter ATP-binding protein n=1 Tax=Paenibacillus sp. R14(2021) TaxID=2859228 RepID=UPI001C612099|nr:ABC transporter ATP-binding protein [Paenibacillus sp. R14(2021)]